MRNRDEELRVSPATARLLRRIRVGLHRWRLDQELADGGSPDSSRDLAIRAAQLTDEKARREIARSLRRVVLDAERPRDSVVCSSTTERSLEEAVWWIADGLQRCQPSAWVNSSPANPDRA